jgi:Phosphotransferase enzyme family
VSLHRVDPRFLLPHPVDRAVVLGDLDEWRAGLVSAGIEVATSPAGSAPPDVVVTPAQLAIEARSTGARSVIIEGARERHLRPGPYRTSRILLRPTRQRPTLALPLDQPAPASYALEHWSVVDRRWKAARMRSARVLVSRGLFPAWGSPIITVATREIGPPAFVAAAAELGVPGNVGWFLTFGQGDALSRNAFQLFLPGSDRPEWILKFARVAGYSERFDNDERGLRLARAVGGAVAARAPRLVGRFDVGGLHASVETAVAGRRLRDLLRTPGDRAAKLRLIDRVGEWILELGCLTATTADDTVAERARLRLDVVPRWSELGATPSLVDAVPALPAVTQHNDLGTWNVVADGDEFVVVDWENVRERALPLWDLLYFLADALVLLDGGGSPEELPLQVARLFAGEARSSPALFEWVGRAAAETGIAADALGPLATLCWLSHSHSFGAHNADLAVFTPREPPRTHGIEGIARAWMEHPGLGPAWSARRA